MQPQGDWAVSGKREWEPPPELLVVRAPSVRVRNRGRRGELQGSGHAQTGPWPPAPSGVRH